MGNTLARMMVGSAATLAVALGGARAARGGDDGPCATVHAPHDLPAAWAKAVHDLERQIAQLPTTDCQRQTLSIELVDGSARIIAVAGDGRRAERTVRQPSALAATGLGLVMSISVEEIPAAPPQASPAPDASAQGAAPPPAPSASSAPSAALAPATSAPAATSAPRVASAPLGASAPAEARPSAPPPGAPVFAPATAAPHPVHAWLGFALGGRVGAPGSITMLDIETRIDVLLGHWLVFAAIRDVPLGLRSSQGVETDPYRELGAGLGAGRRFSLGRTSVDLGILPSVAVMHMEVDLPQPQPNGKEGIHGDDVELRIGAFARLAVPLSPEWQLSLTADSDIVPANLSTPTRIDIPAGVVMNQPVPPFPAWTSGLRLGISGELL